MIVLIRFICFVTLAVAQSAMAQAPPDGKLKSALSSTKLYTARILSEVQIGDSETTAGGGWCYQSDPAIVFGRDRLLFRADLKGNVVQLLEAAHPISNLSCSEDGRTISFTNPQNSRFSIMDVEANEVAGYEVATFRKLMSPDGNVFAVKAEPRRIFGPDILLRKRVLRVISEDVHWTKDLVFVPASPRGDRDKFRILRLPDLSEVGVIEYPVDRAVKSIFECSGFYFVTYDDDNSRKYSIIEQIRDPRLNGASKAKFIPLAPQWYGFCSIKFPTTRELNESTGVRLLRGDRQMTLDLRDIRPFWGRNVTKDGSVLLAFRKSGKPGEPIHTVAGFAGFRVER